MISIKTITVISYSLVKYTNSLLVEQMSLSKGNGLKYIKIMLKCDQFTLSWLQRIMHFLTFWQVLPLSPFSSSQLAPSPSFLASQSRPVSPSS